ncbi:MAG TPA: FUSC family protein [Streptosporangiaceae bacterium]
MPFKWVSWSRAALIRALRATVIVPGLFALCFEVIGNAQMTVFAVFGAFGALLFASFGGSRRDKAVAHGLLTAAGCVVITIGTLASGSMWLAVLVTIPVTFAIFFAGVAGPNAAAGVTAVLLAYVLPVAAAGPLSDLPWKLAGYLLASVVATAAVLLFSPRSAGDRLRATAAAAAAAQAHHLEAAVAGTATPADLAASVAAKHELMNAFSSSPYRPIGLAAADQGLAGVIHMLEWCAGLSCDAMGGHLDLSLASSQDRQVLTDAACALRSVAALLSGDGQDVTFDLQPIWQARAASAAHMQQLAGDPVTVREQVGYAFHAQAIGLAASAAAADAMIAAGRASRDRMARERQRWVDGLPQASSGPSGSGGAGGAGGQEVRGPWPARITELIAADATSRSVWFRNSARGAAALAGAVLVARLTNVEHGFWVVLGTLSVLRTSAAATGSTALRAVGGTAVGFAIGAALLLAIGTAAPILWAVLPVAVFIAAYAPGAAPFAAGQAAFTVTVVVLFNLLDPAGWTVGLVRIEDVAIGCAVSAVVGTLFWPRGAASVVGDNLAQALRSGADYLTESARWALELGEKHPEHAITAIGAGSRLDDAIRGYLTEQGSKRIAKQDLWVLVMAAQRIRLTAHSLASLSVRQHSTHQRGSSGSSGSGGSGRSGGSGGSGGDLGPGYLELSVFYNRIAAQVGPPGRDPAEVVEIDVPLEIFDDESAAGRLGSDPDAIWVSLHLEQLGSHAISLPGPAVKLARIRRTPWWRAPQRVASSS